MRQSFFTPPGAGHGDVDFGVPPERPRAVGHAVICLWTLYGISIAAVIWRFADVFMHTEILSTPLREMAPPLAAVLAIYGLLFLFAYWWYSAIGNGGHWARIFYLASALLLAACALVWLYFYLAGVVPFTEKIAAGLVYAAVDLCAACLLLTRPAREWFRAMKGR